MVAMAEARGAVKADGRTRREVLRRHDDDGVVRERREDARDVDPRVARRVATERGSMMSVCLLSQRGFSVTAGE